jgi:riboflavin synthase
MLTEARMFTGIVEEIGAIKEISSKHLLVGAGKITEDLKLGESVSINGVCLTATAFSRQDFTVDLMPETIRRTAFSGLHYGDKVNLERAMPVSGRFGGHFVQGHVDGVGRVISIVPEEEARIVKIAVDSALTRYIVEKGFVAVDGVSLTVVNTESGSFAVSLVTFTGEHTTLGEIKPGKNVNIEVDIIAKYVEKFSKPGKDEIMINFLKGQS